MLFRTTSENQSHLLSLPESGMGYQLITARFPSEYKSRKLLVLNSELFIEHDESEWLFFSKIVREGWNETKAAAKEQSLQSIELTSKKEYFNIVAEEDATKKKAAKDNPVQSANGWMAYIRLSAFYDDKRIDRVNKCLKPGSYTTTIEDYFTCTINKYDPIDRYAIPNDDPIKWVFNIIPSVNDTFQQGIAQPDFGKKGGGVECYFEKGTSFGSFTSEAEFRY
jgi:hypothetical protein